jgi:hypothetical protein
MSLIGVMAESFAFFQISRLPRLRTALEIQTVRADWNKLRVFSRLVGLLSGSHDRDRCSLQRWRESDSLSSAASSRSPAKGTAPKYFTTSRKRSLSARVTASKPVAIKCLIRFESTYQQNRLLAGEGPTPWPMTVHPIVRTKKEVPMNSARYFCVKTFFDSACY